MTLVLFIPQRHISNIVARPQLNGDLVNFRKEIDRLYDVDFGNKAELTFRIMLTIFGAIGLYQYLGWTIGFYWAGGYFFSLCCFFAFLRTRPETCSNTDCVIASGILLTSMISFIWLPAILSSENDIAVRTASTAAIGTFMIVVVRRADTYLWLVICEGIFFFSVSIVMFFGALGSLNNGWALFVTALSLLGLAGYFFDSLLIYRRRRLQLVAAAQRSVQAQKMEAIGQLVGGVAHDFNNILTALIGNLELYAEVHDRDQKDLFVRDAKTSAELATQTVKQLLAYSRQSRLDVKPVRVTEIFQQLENFGGRLLPSSIALEFRETAFDMTIFVDPSQLVTALINLVLNARDAITENGTVTVNSRICVIDPNETKPIGALLKPGQYIEISVRDNGRGIPSEHLSKVTTPFFTTKPVGKGSGLGLSMVEGFARQSGGGLRISSSDAGTNACVLLPIIDQDLQALSVKATSHTSPAHDGVEDY